MVADTVTPAQPLGVNLNAEYEHRKEEAVKKIMQKKNEGDEDYSILELPADCSAEEVRRAFLKLSLLVHPDKNKSCPDATEAFKHVLDACDRLKKLSDHENDQNPKSRQCCVMCGGTKDGGHLKAGRYYCSLNCIRKFLDSRAKNNLQ